MQKKEIQQKYNDFARWYDLAEGIPELLGVKKFREHLLQQASGKVLEVAVGTGKNLPYYPKTCQLTAIDLSPAMLARARKRAAHLGMKVQFLIMDGERLGFPDRHFDMVIDSLTLCTFPDPVMALREMARVCRLDGRILLLEHGRSDRFWIGRWQDRREARHVKQLGCHWNRQPLELIRQAGLRVITARRTFFGIFHAVEAQPAEAAPISGG